MERRLVRPDLQAERERVAALTLEVERLRATLEARGR